MVTLFSGYFFIGQKKKKLRQYFEARKRVFYVHAELLFFAFLRFKGTKALGCFFVSRWLNIVIFFLYEDGKVIHS